MTSDHNRSELGIQDHSNEQSSSKLVPKVVPLAVKTATSRQELELLFHHHIAMLRTTGADEGTGSIPGVPDVPTYEFNDEQISWKSSEEDDDDEVNVSEDDDNNDDSIDKDDEDDNA
ncbi:hypothetical protein Tco_1036491, partial [Tanacetum coccineum]